jgi:hypothetical protein
MRGDAPHMRRRGGGCGEMAIGSEAKDRGLVRTTTLWSRWTHDSGGLAACRGGGAVVSVVAR